MKLFLFGEIGSGKSYIGHLLNTRFGLYFHDADDDLPASIREAVRGQRPISEAMRDEFTEIIIARLHKLGAAHRDFCVAQALFKNRHREKVLLAVPDLTFVWVRSTPELIAGRLRERTGHLATAYYGEIVNPGFEAPTIPHQWVENTSDSSLLMTRLSRLLTSNT